MLVATPVSGLVRSDGLPLAGPAKEFLSPTVEYSEWGVPRTINAVMVPVPFDDSEFSLGTAEGPQIAQRFFAEFATDFPVFDWAHLEFRQISIDQGPLGWKVYRVSQIMDGVPVRNSDMVLHVDQNGALRYFHGNFYSDLFAEPLDFVMAYDEALAKAKANLLPNEVLKGMELEYVDPSITGDGPRALMPVYVAFTGGRVLQLDAVSGLVVGDEQMDAFALQTSLKYLSHRKELPGTTIYDSTLSGYLGQIYNKWGTWGWTSFDNADTPMRVYYNYCFCDGDSDNCVTAAGDCDCTIDPQPLMCTGLAEREPQLAFWYTGINTANFRSQSRALGASCGDGACQPGEGCIACPADCGACPASCPNGTCDQGETFLVCPEDCRQNDLTAGAVVGLGNGKLDILAHEFAHGFNQNTARLIYQDEPGAAAEGFADCFAAMVDAANWSLFESSGFTTHYGQSVVRSLSDPHQTNLLLPEYVDDNATCEALYSHYGHQPDHFLEKSTTCKAADFGGVHEDSGILGKACWLLGSNGPNVSGGISVTGQGRAATGYVFHYAQRQFLTSTSKFTDVRNALVTVALLYDYAQNDPTWAMCTQTTNAMDAVGLWSSNGNVAGSLKAQTNRSISAVEQSYLNGYRRFVFYRHDSGSNSRLKYLRYTSGSGWARYDLPSITYMSDVSPSVADMTLDGVEESSVFYQTTSNALTRAVVRGGTVIQPPASEALATTSDSRVGAVPAGSGDGAYGIAYRTADGTVHVKYLTHPDGDITGALVPYGDYGVLVLPSPATPLTAFGGLSMTRGDGEVWLAYQKRVSVGGTYLPGDVCVTHISETAFAVDYPWRRYWAEPTCFNAPLCNGARFNPTASAAQGPLGDVILTSYRPTTTSATRYYLVYPADDDRDPLVEAKDPVILTFTWDPLYGISGPTRPVLVDKDTSYTTPVVGGLLTDLSGNLRMYYTDTDGYISELVKHGY